MKLESMIALALGLVGAGLVAAIVFGPAELEPLTCAEKQQEFDTYRMCMQTASTTGCIMEIEDFARRAELETQLNECE